MNQREAAVRALAVIRWRRTTLYVLPWRSAGYGLVSCAIVVFVLLSVDRLLLGSLERGGWTAGELWARHNRLVEDQHRRKTTTDQCQLREWTGEPLAEKTPGTRRILVIGDSFVWGPPYLTLNHLWWRQLAMELARRGYHDVQVVAAGHPGWSTRQQLDCARRLIPEVQPDIVIWGYVTNDPDEKVVRQIFDSQDRFPLGQRARVALKRVLPNLMFKFESLRNQKLAQQYAGPEYGYAYADWELQLLHGENLARYQETVAEVGQLLRSAGIPALLLTLPSWPCREYFEPRYAPILPLWETADVPVHNSLAAFVSRYGNAPQQGPDAIRWGINPADSHPGPQATYFHAVQAADYLMEHWPDLLGPRDENQAHELAINDWLPANLNVRQTGTETRDTLVAPANATSERTIGQTTVQTFELEYPESTQFLPSLPLEEPTALVALRFPLSLSEIHLEGAGLAGARVWVSLVDPVTQCDEDKWREVGKFYPSQAGRAWFVHFTPPELSDRPVAAIRFSADVPGPDRRLTLTLIRHPRAAERR